MFVVSNDLKNVRNVIQMTLKRLFKKLRKLPSNWGISPMTQVYNTFELPQFAQHAVQLQHVLNRIF